MKRQLCFPVHQTSWLTGAENGCVGGSMGKCQHFEQLVELIMLKIRSF